MHLQLAFFVLARRIRLLIFGILPDFRMLISFRMLTSFGILFIVVLVTMLKVY